MRNPQTLLLGIVCGLLHAVLYLAFVFNLGARELFTSLLVGAIATTATIVFMTAGEVYFKLRARDVLQAWRIPWLVVAGMFQVLRGLRDALFKPRRADAQLSIVPFDAGRPDDPVDAGRRALAVTYTTATPNSIILDVVVAEQIMLYHQLVPADLSTMTQNLGARP